MDGIKMSGLQSPVYGGLGYVQHLADLHLVSSGKVQEHSLCLLVGPVMNQDVHKAAAEFELFIECLISSDIFTR